MTVHLEDAHTLSAQEAVQRLRVDPQHGLARHEVAQRFAQHGANELQRTRPPSALAILARQFAGLMQLMLAAAAALSAALGELADVLAIAAVLVLNALLGFAQEMKAESALRAMRGLIAPLARVRRGGAHVMVPARELVPGDVVLLEPGDIPPADARLLHSANLQTAEAALTGESLAVDKDHTSIGHAAQPLGERQNMVFAGTHVTRGTGLALVTSTGTKTQIGRVAQLLGETRRVPTPLQAALDKLGRNLLLACLALIVALFALGLARGYGLMELLLLSVALAVASVPEGLPAVVTVSLALGVQRMAKRGALVRRLASVETLGVTEVICSDKTGTLTEGRMRVRELWSPGDEHELHECLVACNDAELDGRGGGTGDPLEVALLEAAAARGLTRAPLEARAPRVSVEPFDAATRRMVVTRDHGGRALRWLKGAPEVILPACGASEAARERLHALARDGLRVIACAVEEPGATPRLLGLVGLADPPRAASREAVARCRSAGIRPVMITGDHPLTARVIARELGVLGPADELLAGEELAQLDDDALTAKVERVAVYARVTPQDKLRIVRAWQALGRVVAMTGDGVNDAPALKAADIGIAMGRTGAEVTKEAADLVLTSDDFSTIVTAVEEGRAIFDNIRKVTRYLLTTNASEIVVMTAAVVMGLPLPFLPLALLWLNLVTDSLPALALVVDPPHAELLRRRPQRRGIIDSSFLGRFALGVLVLSGVTLASFLVRLDAQGLVSARSHLFDVLVLGQLALAFTMRSDREVLWSVGAFSNLRLVVATGLTAALHLSLHVLPFTATLLELAPLTASSLAVDVALALVPVTVLETWKLIRRRPLPHE